MAARQLYVIFRIKIIYKVRIHNFFQMILNICQTFQKNRIKRTTFSIQNHLHSLFMRISFLVHTVTDQRIIGIRQWYDLSRNWNFLSHKPIRISFSIITFMVPAADLISNFQQYLSLIHLEILKHGSSDQCMCLHNIKFFFCKLTRLIQNLLINSYLTNIMKRRCHRDHILLRPWQSVLPRLLDETLQK